MRIKGRPSVIYDSDGSAILLNMRTGRSHLLNSSAGPVWALLERGLSLPDAVRDVASYFSINPEQFERDLAPIIRDLKKEGFLKEVRTSSTHIRFCWWKKT